MKVVAWCVGVVVVGCLLVAGNVLADSWEQLTDMSASARSGHTIVSVKQADGTVVVLMYGGRNEHFMPLGDLWRWDPVHRTWIELDPVNPPPPRGNHGAAGLDGRMVVGYGQGSDGVLGDMHSYDPTTNVFTELDTGARKQDIPEPHAYAPWAPISDTSVFFAGGHGASGPEPLMNAWITQVADSSNPHQPNDPSWLPPNPVNMHILSIPGKYAITPFSVAGNPAYFGGILWTKSFSNEINVWDPEPSPWGTWSVVTPTGEEPLARALAGYAAIPLGGGSKAEWGDMILIMGGESADKSRATTDVQIYNSVDNVWSFGTDMPMALSDFAAAVVPGDADTYEVITFGGVNAEGDRVPWTFVYTSDIPVTGSGCVSDATTLCLNGRRFQIRVSWEDFEGNTGEGFAHGLTSDTGYFWFFDDANVELVLKVLDGTVINGHYWVYYGSLSDVWYEITVTDTSTGTTHTYTNPSGNFASVGDTEAFPGP